MTPPFAQGRLPFGFLVIPLPSSPQPANPPSPPGRLITLVICGGGIIPDRLRWIRKINVGRGLRPERSEEVLLGYSRRYFCLLCTPISLAAQRNGGTRQRNAFQPLQFAPARRGKVHYFRNTALRYSSAVRLPLLFPKKSFGFFGDPIFPFIRGLKRSTGRTAVPIPDRHRSGRRRFSFCICRPVVFG